MRQTLYLPKEEDPNIYKNLERSLESGLPNEVDFVINICTLLSSEGKYTLILDKAPQLVDLLLNVIGIFDTGTLPSALLNILWT